MQLLILVHLGIHLLCIQSCLLMPLITEQQIELVSKIINVHMFNPITYGILTFRQLFGPVPENRVTVNGLI